MRDLLHGYIDLWVKGANDTETKPCFYLQGMCQTHHFTKGFTTANEHTQSLFIERSWPHQVLDYKVCSYSLYIRDTLPCMLVYTVTKLSRPFYCVWKLMKFSSAFSFCHLRHNLLNLFLIWMDCSHVLNPISTPPALSSDWILDVIWNCGGWGRPANCFP